MVNMSECERKANALDRLMLEHFNFRVNGKIMMGIYQEDVTLDEVDPELSKELLELYPQKDPTGEPAGQV